MSRLEQPEPREHLLQLYGSDERRLTTNVGHYLSEGLKLGNGLLVIATKTHNEIFAAKMILADADPIAAVQDGRLVFLDAAETLARFMVRGQPDWAAFENIIGSAIGRLQARPDQTGLRAYGELVGLLWNAGRYSAANRLEIFWNKLLNSNHFNLYCAYPIDVFGSEFQTAALDALLCAHTHLLPAGEEDDLEHAIDRSMDDMLGKRATGLRVLMDSDFEPSWLTLPRAEARILWLRNHLPDEAEKILARARQYYQMSHSRAATEIPIQ
jgi:hypothetical protein